jgi:hypothetical protein
MEVAALPSKIGPRHPLRVVRKSAAAVTCLLVTCLSAACGTAAPSASSTPPAPITPAAPTRTADRAPAVMARPVTAAAPVSRCPRYTAATYGIDPDQVADTGGGAQLVTVVAPSAASRAATFTAWARGAGGCWRPASFAGQPGQPFRAQTGHGGLLPYARRVPGDWATPTGLFRFGATVYGNSTVSPTTRYPYHHLVCGDWWDEQPGSPAYDTFQHVPAGSPRRMARIPRPSGLRSSPTSTSSTSRCPALRTTEPASSCTMTCQRGTPKAAWPCPTPNSMPCSGG